MRRYRIESAVYNGLGSATIATPDDEGAWVSAEDALKVEAERDSSVAEQPDVAGITRAVRIADAAFDKTGGSSRHWVIECLLPALEDEGLAVVRVSPRP